MVRYLKRVSPWSLKLLLVLLVSGFLLSCETLGFYQQAARGQLELLLHRQGIENILQNQEYPQTTREKLQLVVDIKDFADAELGLSAKDSYATYVALDRIYVVWNVFAAPEFSVDPVTWCYPVAGCVAYRGYFAENGAKRYSDRLQRRGYDVYTGGVAAYSTLGWFKDSVLSSVLNREDYRLAALIIHELAHQRVYLPGDTTFNESFATAMEREGLRRWLLHQNDDHTELVAIEDRIRQEQFVELVSAYRQQLRELYASEIPENEMRILKQQILNGLRTEYETLKISWGGYTGYDRWFNRPLNNAQLATVSSYNDYVPAFQYLLESYGNNLEIFYRNVEELSQMPVSERKAAIKHLNRMRQSSGERQFSMNAESWNSGD